VRRSDALREEARRLGAFARYGRRRVHRAASRTSPFGLFVSFAKVGTIGFGGGLAVVAQIRSLVVRDRRWLSDREFAEGFALAQALPGTSAGNLVSYVGQMLHGVRGAVASLAGFVLPSFLMMVALAIAYGRLRALPDMEHIFHGLNSAVVALIAVTAWRMGRRALVRRWQWWMAALALVVAIAGATTLEVVIVAGLFGIFSETFLDRRRQRWRRIQRLTRRRKERLAELEQRGLASRFLSDDGHGTASPESGSIRSTRGTTLEAASVAASLLMFVASLGILVTLATVFLRVGAVTFGGGFVMIPIIEQSVVNQFHWLTHQEFADATALGQITPGPVLITATFVGYRVAGLVGAAVTTIAVFTPAFLMTVAATSSLRKFQSNVQVQAFLRGVVPAVVGLLVAAAWSIGRAGIHSWVGVTIAAIAAVVLLRTRMNAAAVIFGAGLARYVVYLSLGR